MIRQTIRRWALHHRTDKSLEHLARMLRPYIQGWINYYSYFYKSELTPTLHRIDAFLIRRAATSSSGCASGPKVQEIGWPGSSEPLLISSLTGRFLHANGRTSGAV